MPYAKWEDWTSGSELPIKVSFTKIVMNGTKKIQILHISGKYVSQDRELGIDNVTGYNQSYPVNVQLKYSREGGNNSKGHLIWEQYANTYAYNLQNVISLSEWEMLKSDLKTALEDAQARDQQINRQNKGWEGGEEFILS